MHCSSACLGFDFDYTLAIIVICLVRRNKELCMFKVSLLNNEANKKWGKDLINTITTDRVINDQLKKHIASFKLFMCELHFST